MLDDTTLKKRVLLRLLGSPSTVIPFIAGMTTMTASWALDWNPRLGLFAGLAGLLTSLGTFLTRLLVRGDAAARKVLLEAEQNRAKARQRALDELDRRLTVSDTDPRPETALRDLRALVKAFEEGAPATGRYDVGAAIDVQSRVSQLFDQCVESLQQTERLWQIARQLQTPAARQPILEQREKLIRDVQASTKQLSDTLVALQRLGAGEHGNAELARLRDELDQSLAVAKSVEERVDHLVKEASVMTTPPPIIPQAKKTKN